jgi:uncharacterized delta-60 repeat protein
LVGGFYTTYSGGTQNKFIRLNTDGTKDTSFNIGTGFAGGAIPAVYVSAIQSDGKIVVGGTFFTFTGTTTNRLVRLNSDGSRDTSFSTNLGAGIAQAVNDIKIQSDGKILVGGIFTSPQNRIIRLNTDGTIDTSFTIGTGFNGSVSSLDIQSDGKIVVAGSFSSYSGVTSYGIIRLNSDGSVDSTLVVGTNGFNLPSAPQKIAIQSDGKILVGGQFTSYSGVTANGLIRLNSNGTIDSSFNIGTGFDAGVWDVLVQPDNKILVSGEYTTFTGTSQSRLVRLNSDGTKDSTFNIGTGFSAGAYVYGIAIDGNSNVYAVGTFTSYNGNSATRFVKLTSTGGFFNCP